MPTRTYNASQRVVMALFGGKQLNRLTKMYHSATFPNAYYKLINDYTLKQYSIYSNIMLFLTFYKIISSFHESINAFQDETYRTTFSTSLFTAQLLTINICQLEDKEVGEYVKWSLNKITITKIWLNVNNFQNWKCILGNILHTFHKNYYFNKNT